MVVRKALSSAGLQVDENQGISGRLAFELRSSTFIVNIAGI